jgi:hypothetical protein
MKRLLSLHSSLKVITRCNKITSEAVLHCGKNTKKNISTEEETDSQSYNSQEPGSTPLYFAGPEDQPRHESVCLRRHINVTPITPESPIIYGTPDSPVRDVRACALSPSGWGTCQRMI